MNNKCIECGIVNWQTADHCVRCGAFLDQTQSFAKAEKIQSVSSPVVLKAAGILVILSLMFIGFQSCQSTFDQKLQEQMDAKAAEKLLEKQYFDEGQKQARLDFQKQEEEREKKYDRIQKERQAKWDKERIEREQWENYLRKIARECQVLPC